MISLRECLSKNRVDFERNFRPSSSLMMEIRRNFGEFQLTFPPHHQVREF